jgi:Hydrazine synthase alpha subunit middle domain
MRFLPFSLLSFTLAGLAFCGCSRPVAPGSLVLAQSPRGSEAAGSGDALDRRYPAGSRVVLLQPPYEPRQAKVISRGLRAAGDPVVSYDGQRVFFAGKARDAGDWQIYEAKLPSGRPRAITSMSGGAMDPALLPDGSVVFASPVPQAGVDNAAACSSALFKQSEGEKPYRLTFAPGSTTDPVVLSDGRILFVYRPPPGRVNSPAPGLYTINNDGTELTAMAGQHERASVLARPRELADGRLVFLASNPASGEPGGRAEFVRLARPYQSRESLLSAAGTFIRSVQPASDGGLLICAETRRPPARALALFRVSAGTLALGQPLLDSPKWNSLEAVPAVPLPRPMGRISSVAPTAQTGQLLCLNVDDTTYHPVSTDTPMRTARVRLLTETTGGKERVLGEVPVQPDGSFMVEVPADRPLGFEALDEYGHVLRRLAPSLWLRPGENRACIGCHALPNRAPHNQRPLAVREPVPRLCADEPTLAQNKN